MDLIVNSDGDAGCVAEWSRAEHEAVGALLVAHMSGEKKPLESLELHEEVLHDFISTSQDEPVSTEWADYSNIAPLGAASRAFLESVFSKSVSAILQQRRSQDVQDIPPKCTEPELSTVQERETLLCTEQASADPAAPKPTTAAARRHFADYQSKSDLPLRISGVSDDDLRPFKSMGLPVQVEGMPKLVRLKGAPPLLLNKQVDEHEATAREKVKESESEVVQEPEIHKGICQLDDTQVALLQDLTSVEGNDLSLEELKNALSSSKCEQPPVATSPGGPETEHASPSGLQQVGEAEIQSKPEPELEAELDQHSEQHGKLKQDPEMEPKPEPEPSPERELEPELEQDPQPEPGPEPELEPEPEVEPELQLEPEPELDPEPDLEPEPEKLIQGGDQQEEIIEINVEEEEPTPVAESQEAQSTDEVGDGSSVMHTRGTGGPTQRLTRHSGNFKKQVFYSLCEETLKWQRARTFRQSIMIDGVGSVIVRRRSDYKNSTFLRIGM